MQMYVYKYTRDVYKTIFIRVYYPMKLYQSVFR